MSYKPASNEKYRLLGLLPIIAEYSLGTQDPDITLSGKYGCIWKYSEDKYCIMIDNPIIASRYLDFEGKSKLKQGEEMRLIVDEAEAKLWLKRLKIPNNRKSQIKYMEAR